MQSTDHRKLPRLSFLSKDARDEQRRLTKAVYEARTPWGEQRFYPPGLHPACRRQREMIVKITDLANRCNHGILTPDMRMAVDYAQRQIDMVEVGEARSVQAFIEVLR